MSLGTFSILYSLEKRLGDMTEFLNVLRGVESLDVTKLFKTVIGSNFTHTEKHTSANFMDLVSF